MKVKIRKYLEKCHSALFSAMFFCFLVVASFAPTSVSDQNLSFFYIKNPVSVSSPSKNAGFGVKKYGDKFLYAHSTLGFSRLKTLNEGSEIVLEIDGKAEKYIVSRREIMQKSTLDENSGLRSAIFSAQFRGNAYDLALMTCGNGENDDTNYRLILFASKA
ncbi:sortase [Candidatus Saccharibacteria bacterium]|nr:sortase [Candidatus Saccharibacteria bacterium]